MPPSNALLVEGEYNSVQDSSITRHKPMQWKIINELDRHFLTDQMQLPAVFFVGENSCFSIINFVIVQATVFSFN